MDRLKQYYNERFRRQGMPDYSDLTDIQKQSIRRLTDYAFYELGKATEELKQAIRDTVTKWTSRGQNKV